MLDQSVFTETIHEVAEIIRTSATPLSKEEILSYYKEMEINEQQEYMVLEFLLTPHEEEEAEEETFVIRPYLKSELAHLYNPYVPLVYAMRKMREWIRNNKE